MSLKLEVAVEAKFNKFDKPFLMERTGLEFRLEPVRIDEISICAKTDGKITSVEVIYKVKLNCGKRKEVREESLFHTKEDALEQIRASLSWKLLNHCDDTLVMNI